MLKPPSLSSDVEQVDALFERQTMRRVDLRLLPVLGTLYALALIDRSNMGVGASCGYGQSSCTVGARYSIVSELPSNMCLRAVGARNLLTGTVIAWGAVQIGMGFVPSWEYLALCRTLLGVFEVKLLLSVKKLAGLYMTSIVAGGFSAILAYALSLLDGKGGLGGWSWIFIIEGMATVIFGIASRLYIPDFPDRNDFLTAEQTALVLRRVEEDRGDSLPDSLKGKVLLHLSDWKVWVYAVMYPIYFVTLILSGMGWNLEMSLLLAVSIFFFAWLSDKYHMRALFLTIQMLMTIIGLVLTAYTSIPGWRYTGIFLTNAGSAGCIPGILAYASNNIVSHSKRAVTTAIMISFGGIGGIIATTIYRQQDFPRYIPGIIATISLQVLALILLGIMTVHLWYENKKVKSGGDSQVGVFLYTL
ncbi:major facilitator superfamily domain-containing protein [Armillaria novae-zelandiae]|uniref:Major facilitator superfamily domain-containing protein n=1 Tax=Armillaria novae-zelandiae TaxID=153914 RepID=A0AA39UNM3_9AGAR|nr:major facilitator superfamily domain-containing protein [Armillaria novae-zelandiae]